MVKDQQLVTSHCTSQKELCLFVFVFQFVIVGFDIFVSTAVHIVELSMTGNVRSWLWSIGQLTKSRWGFVVSEGNYTALHTHSTLPCLGRPSRWQFQRRDRPEGCGWTKPKRLTLFPGENCFANSRLMQCVLALHLYLCYTQRRRDNFPGTQFFLDKFLFSKKGLGQGIPKQLVKLKKVSEFFCGSLSPSENRPLGEKALSGQMLLELNFF